MELEITLRVSVWIGACICIYSLGNACCGIAESKRYEKMTLEDVQDDNDLPPMYSEN